MMASYSDLLTHIRGYKAREKGRNARINNIAEGVAAGRLVETSFGPKGLKKRIDGIVVD